MIEHKNVPAIVADDPAPYSNMVVDDRYVFLAGLVAADLPNGGEAMGDITLETEAVMTAIGGMLETIGLTHSDIVRVDVHLIDLDDMPKMNAAYARYFEGGPYPSRTTVQAARLVEDSRVEITVCARLRG